jgi:large subunit ribosomal protein L23
MALFGSKKDTKDKKDKENVEAPAAAKNVGSKPLVTDRNLSAVIVAPRITEKAVGMSEQNVYTFVVRPNATKLAVRDAIKSLYSVTPVKVNIVNKKAAKRVKGFSGRTVHDKGIKKAYVYLRKGDTINLV